MSEGEGSNIFSKIVIFLLMFIGVRTLLNGDFFNGGFYLLVAYYLYEHYWKRTVKNSLFVKIVFALVSVLLFFNLLVGLINPERVLSEMSSVCEDSCSNVSGVNYSVSGLDSVNGFVNCYCYDGNDSLLNVLVFDADEFFNNSI